MFQPRWLSPDPEVRRQAAMKLSIQNPDRGMVLGRLIQDNSPQVREAAIKRVNDLDLLRAYLHGEADPRVRNAASVRYRQLLVGDCDATTLERELGLCNDPTIIAYVAQKARDPEARRHAIRRIEQPALLAEIALHDDEERNRCLAAQLIEDDKALSDLAQRAQSKGDEGCRATANCPQSEIETETDATATATADDDVAATPQVAVAEARPKGYHQQPDSLKSSAPIAQPAENIHKPTSQAGASNMPEALCRAMHGLASVSYLPNLQSRRRNLTARWHALPQPPEAALQRRFRQANIRALTKTVSTNSEASRARRELEKLTKEFNPQRGEPTSQRIAAARRNLDGLRGEDIDSAHARIALQRLYRQLPRYEPEQAQRQPSRNALGEQKAILHRLNKHLIEAEKALANSDFVGLQGHIREALQIASSGAQ
ncbi:HEAT repeat domain-containing protein [Halorhodospira halochloris]|uniref:HEAT repeat domain-containing protein n=1 Tax=Halorhodospira halochloris TaxID=1052 RepID=UPI001EE7CA68|nr:HEAT repeat domain-containing protein [Halorhodospira halochloris]MCG5531246.1 HEAT repeat domain-containing protein [Halorhodospira halochloris]